MNELDVVGPPPELLYRRRLRPLESIRRLWRARELVWTLAERDFRVRYKQAVLGVAWALITPVVFMGAFTLVFQRVARVDTSGVPYPLFSLIGLLPWTFFSTSLNQGAMSLLANKALLNKVACPREAFPLASVGVAAIDGAISLLVVALLMGVYGIAPAASSVWTLALSVVPLALSLGVALFMSVLVVYLRDVRYLVPIVLQLGLFVTPIGYGLDAVPAGWRPLYCALNPLAPSIDGYRRAVLYGSAPQWDLVALGALGAAAYLIVGFAVFRRLEGGVADVA